MKVSEKYEDSWYKVLKFKVTKEQLKFLAANFNRFLFVAISSQRFPLYFSHFSQVFLLHFWLLFRPFSVLAMANNELANKISSVSFWKLKWRKCLVYTRTAAKRKLLKCLSKLCKFHYETFHPHAPCVSLIHCGTTRRQKDPSQVPECCQKSEIKILPSPKKKKVSSLDFWGLPCDFLEFITISFHFLSAFPFVIVWQALRNRYLSV